MTLKKGHQTSEDTKRRHRKRGGQGGCTEAGGIREENDANQLGPAEDWAAV